MSGLLRVGIIGAGSAGTAHAAAYGRVPGVTVAAVWSRTRQRAETLAATLGAGEARVYDGWEELIRDGDIDALSVATPAVLRREPIVAAFERGLHVLAEKELANSLEDARAVAALAARAGTVAAVSLNWRYSPGSLVARRAVEQGRIGRLQEILKEWRFHIPLAFLARAPVHMLRSDQGGGALRQGGSHEFDQARFLTGWEFLHVAGRLERAPERAAVPGRPEADADAGYALLADMSGGGKGVFRNILTQGQSERQTVLSGEDGTLVMTQETVALQRGDASETLPIPEGDAAPSDVPLLQHTWNRLIADFVAAIRRGDVAHATAPRLPSFADGLRNQEVFAAVERADAERRWVEVRPESQ